MPTTNWAAVAAAGKARAAARTNPTRAWAAHVTYAPDAGAVQIAKHRAWLRACKATTCGCLCHCHTGPECNWENNASPNGNPPPGHTLYGWGNY
jgi:hypothetical protein